MHASSHLSIEVSVLEIMTAERSIFEKRLRELAEELELAAAYAPDEYPSWSAWNYPTHMANIQQLWAVIRPQLKRDVAEAAVVELQLARMTGAFACGDRQTGRSCAIALVKGGIAGLR